MNFLKEEDMKNLNANELALVSGGAGKAGDLVCGITVGTSTTVGCHGSLSSWGDAVSTAYNAMAQVPFTAPNMFDRFRKFFMM